MKKQIAKLIDLKSIITIFIIGGFIYGFIVGVINTDQYMQITVMICTFYFAKKSKGDDTMATIDTRSVEEIKEDIAKIETTNEKEKEGE